MRRRERNLLDLVEVVLGVTIENKRADGLERELLVGPNLGQIENVVAEGFGLFRGHSLL